MKQPSLIMKVSMSLLLVGVLIYFGIYLYRSYQGGVSTVIAYSDSVNQSVEATGILVRSEITVSSSAVAGHMVSLAPAEGEKVAAGDVIATLYASSAGLDTQQQISGLENEIEQLHSVLNSFNSVEDAAKIDADILSAIVSLRAKGARGDLSTLEDDALALRKLVFQRDYAYGSSSTASNLSLLIQDKEAQLTRLRADLGTVSTTLYAPKGGTFSRVTDGFESLLTPEDLEDMTVSQLQQVMAQRPPEDASAVGKVVISTKWYFAAVLPQAQAETLREDHQYTVIFSHDWSGEISMTVERIGDAEGGQSIVVFSSRDNLLETASLRQQTVEVVNESYTGLHIPSQALRTVKQTVTDKEGVEQEISVSGVYALVGAESEFKPVRVLWQGEDYFLVEPIDPVNSESISADRLEAIRLHAGDEVIINTSGLYDGKVVR